MIVLIAMIGFRGKRLNIARNITLKTSIKNKYYLHDNRLLVAS